MCENSIYHRFILAQLNLALESKEVTEIEKTRLSEAKKLYLDTCQKCKWGASNDDKCIDMALDELLRMMPGKDKWKIYPWKNYDWDYGNFIDNNYSAAKTGSSPDGVIKNLFIFITLVRGFFKNPNPGTGSVAGGLSRYRDQYVVPNVDNLESDYPVWCDAKDSATRGHILQTNFEIAQNSPTNKTPPYDDPFFKKFPLAGVHASSYFVRVGSCPREDITTREGCAKRNFEWKSDNCFQPRYAYMNNEPLPIRGIQGAIPSTIYSGFALAPVNIKSAFLGKSNTRMYLQPCPGEGFKKPLTEEEQKEEEKKEKEQEEKEKAEKEQKQKERDAQREERKRLREERKRRLLEGFFDDYDPNVYKQEFTFGRWEALIVVLGLFLGYFFYDAVFRKAERLGRYK